MTMFGDAHLRPRAANFQPLTPVSFLAGAREAHPARPAVIWRDLAWDYAGLHAMAVRMARALERAGVGAGDVVSIVARNRPEMLAAHFAVPSIGAVLSTLNVRLDADALTYVLDHSRSRLLLVDPACAGPAMQAAARAGVPCLTLADPGAAPEGDALDLLSPGPDEAADALRTDALADEWGPVCVNYTSGTTGAPKGAVYHARGAFLNAMGNALALGFGPATRYLWTLPMFHCNGWSHAWAVTAAGGTHVCLDAVEPGLVLGLIDRHEVTHFCCAPVVLHMLLADPAARGLRGAGRRVRVGTGGAAPSAGLIERLQEIGFELTHLYGLTESYGPATICHLGEGMEGAPPERKAAWLARQGFRHAASGAVRIADAGGADVPADGASPGEILLRGNTLMAGYLRDPDATEAAFADGWLRTGDVAVRDADGAIRITDRAKDVIVSGGENISSLEVEAVLQRHPSVLLAAVVAMPDETWGEVPCACVELRPDRAGDAAELDAFCRGRLAGFKVPRRYRFGELPKTATGKIQKFLLRELVRDEAP